MTTTRRAVSLPFAKYEIDSAYDEMFDGSGRARPHYEALYQRLLDLTSEELEHRQQTADLSFLHQGITFTVYGRTEGTERIFPFDLLPRIITNAEWATIERGLTYRDFLGNIVHHFDIPGGHRQLNLTAEAQVEVRPFAELPQSLPPESWNELSRSEYDMLLPSQFTQATPLLEALAQELSVEQRDDPLSLLRELTSTIYDAFEYAPDSTAVDSPIDDALRNRKGICQDFTHIMLALVRPLGIPCRYVSGYLYHNNGARSSPGASHAWVEALLPGLGWVGFDPTNNLIACERHIRVALGRDYADVPPTRGVFQGGADTELSVAVRVSLLDETPTGDLVPVVQWSTTSEKLDDQAQEQQQQQGTPKQL